MVRLGGLVSREGVAAFALPRRGFIGLWSVSLGGWSWGSACGSGAHPYTSHAHMGARTWRRRRRARGLLPIPISLVIPLCLCPRRTLRVVFVFWCVVWGWRVACFGGKHLKPVHTCLPRHLGGSLSSRLVRWPAPSPARRRCQTSPEPKGRLLPSHVVPRATRAPIVARAHPALHAHVARMICLSQCLQHDPATRVPTVLAVSRPIEVIAKIFIYFGLTFTRRRLQACCACRGCSPVPGSSPGPSSDARIARRRRRTRRASGHPPHVNQVT